MGNCIEKRDNNSVAICNQRKISMAEYSKTPLVNKMGIKEGMRGIFVHAPEEVQRLFEGASARFAKELSGDFDYIHLFAINADDLKTDFIKAKKFLKPNGILWVSWPKSDKLGTNLNENKVRDIGLAAGLVDIKVAAVDDTWSGLKFVYRLKDR